MIYDLNNHEHRAVLRQLAKEGGHTVEVTNGDGNLLLQNLRPDGYLAGYIRGDVLRADTGNLHPMLLDVSL